MNFAIFAVFVDEIAVISSFFDVILSVVIEKCEFLNETICKNIFVFVIWLFDVAKEIDDFCDENEHAIVDFFSVLHTKLTALIEKWEFLTSFEISWLRICSYNSLLKLKFCLQNLQIIRTFVISKFDNVSIDSDIISNVFNWKFEFFETRRTNVFENVFVKILLKRFNEIHFD